MRYRWVLFTLFEQYNLKRLTCLMIVVPSRDFKSMRRTFLQTCYVWLLFSFTIGNAHTNSVVLVHIARQIYFDKVLNERRERSLRDKPDNSCGNECTQPVNMCTTQYCHYRCIDISSMLFSIHTPNRYVCNKDFTVPVCKAFY